jgi:hypothetical protein
MHYDLGSDAGYEQLYRYLTQQPAVPKPALGGLVALPPKLRASVFTSSRQADKRRSRWWLLVPATLLAVLLALAGHLSFGPGPKDEVVPVTPSAKQILRGEILDAETLSPLAGVQVSLPEQQLAQITGADGQYRFELDVPAGAQVRLRASREGYKGILADPPAGSDSLNTHRMWRVP